jgi:hypothetical protein
MRFAMRLLAVVAVGAGLGLVGAPVAGAADTQPPTAPSNVRVLAVKPDTVTIAFDRSTDNVGLKWYVARVEGVRQQATTSPGGTEIGGLSGLRHKSRRVWRADRRSWQGRRT